MKQDDAVPRRRVVVTGVGVVNVDDAGAIDPGVPVRRNGEVVGSVSAKNGDALTITLNIASDPIAFIPGEMLTFELTSATVAPVSHVVMQISSASCPHP